MYYSLSFLIQSSQDYSTDDIESPKELQLNLPSGTKTATIKKKISIFNPDALVTIKDIYICERSLFRKAMKLSLTDLNWFDDLLFVYLTLFWLPN